MEAAREAQLHGLMERGFSPQEAAQYCDGVSSLEDLVELITSDADALDRDDAAVDSISSGGRIDSRTGGSSMCVIA